MKCAQKLTATVAISVYPTVLAVELVVVKERMICYRMEQLVRMVSGKKALYMYILVLFNAILRNYLKLVYIVFHYVCYVWNL